MGEEKLTRQQQREVGGGLDICLCLVCEPGQVDNIRALISREKNHENITGQGEASATVRTGRESKIRSG